MADSIVVNFYDAVFDAAMPSIAVQQGQFALSSEWPLSIDSGLVSGAVSINPGWISFLTANPPMTVGGSVAIPLATSGGVDPILTVTGFSGDAFVGWTTTNGQPVQVTLQSGVPVTLTGFAS